MPVIYIRLPHYLSSFLRNLDEDNPIPEGEPIKLEEGDPLYYEATMRMTPNQSGRVVLDCFSESQWSSMRRGHYIDYSGGLHLDVNRDNDKPLMVSEVYLFSGHEEKVRRDCDTMELMPDFKYYDTWQPFYVPRVVVRNGREHRVRSDWFMPVTSGFRDEVEKRFHCALMRFIAGDVYGFLAKDMSRSKMEALDAFMLRYDIRDDKKTREAIKQQMKRSRLALAYNIDASTSHVKWINEHAPATEQPRCHNAPRRVLCHDTGIIYPSQSAFARAIGAHPQHVIRAAGLGQRVKGHSFELLDD